MNVIAGETKAATQTAASRPAIADGDIHPTRRTAKDLYPWLERRWVDQMNIFGAHRRHGWEQGAVYVPSQPNASRRDAYPPEGGRQGSSLAFLQAQHLDPNNVELGILNPLVPSGTGQGLVNMELSTALCSAVNDWQVAEWTSRDHRLKASIVVNNEDAEAAVAEIHKRAGDPNFAQVHLFLRTAEPLGARRYWPIYEAAAEAGLPIGIHAFGYSGYPVSGAGWPSYYMEEMVGHAAAGQAVVTSFVLEGVLARLPKLKIIMIEAGFSWAAALSWRLDKVFHRLHAETPYLKKPPSAYIREQIWFTTQPIDEPEPREHLRDVMDWIGWDRLMFATDYPHWDFDDPATCLPVKISEEQRWKFLVGNARAVYAR